MASKPTRRKRRAAGPAADRPRLEALPRTPKKAGERACGLCGATRRLTQAPCCGNWICDDEDDYVVFSFARNSCHRNHRRLTLCGHHADESHAGTWQTCARCREGFETELYVYFGTNEFNFETLPDPPSFKPTLCVQCRRRIHLGEGGYSVKSGAYTCDRCTPELDDRFV